MSLIPTTPQHFASLKSGDFGPDLILAPGGVAPPEVIDMLAGLTVRNEALMSPAGWLVVEAGEVVGLLTITKVPAPGDIEIGYGFAAERWGRGLASRAVGELLAWARERADLRRVLAETSVENLASQRVLEVNGFARIGERVDEEDGPVICWSFDLV
jgi:RimJ/RimL family protein N-acetyltransferase